MFISDKESKGVMVLFQSYVEYDTSQMAASKRSPSSLLPRDPQIVGIRF